MPEEIKVAFVLLSTFFSVIDRGFDMKFCKSVCVDTVDSGLCDCSLSLHHYTVPFKRFLYIH